MAERDSLEATLTICHFKNTVLDEQEEKKIIHMIKQSFLFYWAKQCTSERKN